MRGSENADQYLVNLMLLMTDFSEMYGIPVGLHQVFSDKYLVYQRNGIFSTYPYNGDASATKCGCQSNDCS